MGLDANKRKISLALRELAQGMALVLLPWLAVLLGLFGVRLRPRIACARPWLVVWVGLFLLGLAVLITDPGKGLILVGDSLAGLLAGLVLRPAPLASVGMAVGLVLLAALGAFQSFPGRQVWQAFGATNLHSSILRLEHQPTMATLRGSSGVATAWSIPPSVSRISVKLPMRVFSTGGSRSTDVKFKLVAWWPDKKRQWSDYPSTTITAGPTWTEPAVSLTLPSSRTEAVLLVLREPLGVDATIGLRRPVVRGFPSAVQLHPSGVPRVHLLSTDPNLAAHGAVTAALATLAIEAPSYVTVPSMVAAAAAVALTRSRAAALGLVAGLLLMTLSLKPWRRDHPLVATLLTIGAFGAAATGTLALFAERWPGLGHAVSRIAIWRFALSELQHHRLLGLSSQHLDFATVWAEQHPHASTPAITHAHNLWLQFGAEFGILGLLGISLVVVTLVRLSWSRLAWRGLLLLLPVLMMNMVDVTLLYPGVLFPVLFAVNHGLGASRHGDGSPLLSHRTVTTR